MLSRALVFIAHCIAFIVLTALTQIGGIAYAIALLAVSRSKPLPTRAVTVTFWFLILYVAFTLGAAKTQLGGFGARVALPCFAASESGLKLQSPLYCLLNRHYVTPQMLQVAERLARHMNEKFPGTVTIALDGSFPMFDGFPLLPHLSHDDGRKLDFAFYYEDEQGNYLPGVTRSPIGYWAFEEPLLTQRPACAEERSGFSMRWDLPWFKRFHNHAVLDEERTAEALRWLAQESPKLGVTRVFIEPHLAERFGVRGAVVRFQGCNAARHDDHIHIQVVPR